MDNEIEHDGYRLIALKDGEIGLAAPPRSPKPCDAAELVALLERIVSELRPVRNFEDEDPTGPDHRVKRTG